MALQDRTEPATPRRKEEAREEGRVAKSMDINAAMVLLVSLLILKVSGPYVLTGMAAIARDTFSSLHVKEVGPEGVRSLMLAYGMKSALICLPIVLGAGAVGLAANVLQVGFRITSKPLVPDLTRIDPLKGIVRLVSWRSMVELVKSLVKVAVVGYVVYAFLRSESSNLMKLSGLSVGAAGMSIAGMCWSLLARACAAMLVIAILDYMYQRISFEQSLKMTKQEVKEEYKRSEGDPQIKARIRQRQREMARNRMMQEVPKADVVITNPTHIAIAIKYDSESMNAPMVVAKGQRLVAEKIKAIAEVNGVPIVENKPVARLLYKVAEVGQQIPEELYQAVAEILAFVYRASQRARTMRRAS